MIQEAQQARAEALAMREGAAGGGAGKRSGAGAAPDSAPLADAFSKMSIQEIRDQLTLNGHEAQVRGASQVLGRHGVLLSAQLTRLASTPPTPVCPPRSRRCGSWPTSARRPSGRTGWPWRASFRAAAGT